MKIYESYSEEPEDAFEDLDDATYSELYGLEMNTFSEDFEFYAHHLKPAGSILELGCGTGRLTRQLLAAGHYLTGIDLSADMLKTARETTRGKGTFIRMDMRRISFNVCFDNVVVPYNTLNLLTDDTDLRQCLSGIRDHLKVCGLLLFQIHIPSITEDGCTPDPSFQFQIFDRPSGGKVIKEMARTYHPDRQVLELEERYKIRPMMAGEANLNYRHTLTLSCRSISEWLSLLKQFGFSIVETRCGYNDQGSATSTIWLIAAQRSQNKRIPCK